MRRSRRRAMKNIRSVVVALGLAALAGRAQAENVISVGYAEASPGDRGVQVIVTATNDVAIHAYSLAVAYPANVLELTAISTQGTHVEQLAPDYVAPRLDNQLGIGTLGVIFSFREDAKLKELAPLETGSRPRILARLTFNVLASAPGGAYPVRLLDGIGTPASFNRFSTRGTSIVPRLEDGLFVVSGGHVLTLEKKYLFPGLAASPKIRAYAQHPDPIGGFQIGFTYAKSVLELRDATWAGTSLDMTLGRLGKIEFWVWKTDVNYSPSLARAAAACLFDYNAPFDEGQILPPCTSSPTCRDLVVFTFSLKADADKISQYFDLDLENTGRPGDVDNRFISGVLIGDRSIDPRLVDGRIYFSQGSLRGRLVEALSDEAVSGARVVTDPDGYAATTDSQGRFLLPDLPAGKYSLVVSKAGYYPGRFSSRGDSSGPILVRGEGQTDDVGVLAVYKIPSGTIFVRGRINSDRKIDLSDSIALLNHLFHGHPEPPCLLAADTNDDNRVDLSDAVWLLNHLFLGGPEPPPPYNPDGSGCGPDPTPGSNLACNEIECF